ncbi:MAG TPA: hypothetical protein DHU96_11895 [Actinobacteria bacterium]|nr:hypothetical protein [Actinomycetota bacterium]
MQADPIRRVSVVSTGTVAIRPQHVESDGSPLVWWLMTSRRWTQPLPINAYVIEHEDGLVLFDTGQDRASVTDPGYFPGGPAGLLYRRLARFGIRPDQTLTGQLAAIGYDVSDVTTVVLSHLHQDHIGGLGELGHAEILVSTAEWQTLAGRAAVLRGLMRTHIDLPGLRWRRIAPQPTGDTQLAPFTAAHDLFGDGSMLLLPTPGHTPGSLSLLVRRAGQPPLLMVGDLTYDVHLMCGEQVPGVGDRSQLLAATRTVNAFAGRHPGLVVLPAHDPGAASRLAAASRVTGSRGR